MKTYKPNNILLVGGFPPPYGGILVHIKRIYDYFKRKNQVCNVLDLPYNTDKNKDNPDVISAYNFIKLITTRKKFSVVHIHVTALGNYFFIYLLSIFYKNSNLLLTIHSGSFSEKFMDVSYCKKKIISRIFNNVNKIILVSDAQKSVFKLHFDKYFNKVSVISAFIYPEKKIDVKIKNIFIEKKNEYDTVFLTSGGFFDYYGYDMLIDFLKKNEKVFGIFSLYGKGIPDYKTRIVKEIDNLNNAICFDGINPDNFNWLLSETDIFIRNTDRDGDSVAIRESAYWKTRIIASDAVKRPEGVELFRFNNLDEFQHSFNLVCENVEYGVVKNSPDNLKKLVKEYNLS